MPRTFQSPKPNQKRYFEYNNNNRNDDSGQRGDETSPKEVRERLGRLPENVMSYYRQVSATLEAGFDENQPEAKCEFLTNVFGGLKDECVVVSRNQTVSRILEVLFAQGLPSHLSPVFCKFCKELSIVVFDAFASHVLQALIQYLPSMFDDQVIVESTEMSTDLKASTEDLCTFMESHLCDVMTHVYGSHVLRSLLETLGGVAVKAEIIRSRISLKQRSKEIADHGPVPSSTASKSFSSDYETWFEKLSQKVFKLCNYEDHLSDNNYCPVLQTVLLILHKKSPSQYEEMADTILEKTCASLDKEDLPADDIMNRLPHVVQNEIGSYLVELIISLSSGPRFEEVFNKLFKGKLMYFAVHPYANYVLQKMLSTISDEKLMQTVLDDISKYIEDILAVNHCGVVTKLAEACRRIGVCEDQFLQVLMSSFHCYEPETSRTKLVPLLASFQTYEIFVKSAEDTENEAILKNVIIHGSLLLQQLFQFSKPVVIVTSLLDLSPAELLFLCCDKFGSFVIDVFFQSATVKEKQKDSFIKKLLGLYIKMACNRMGSRILENIWKIASIQQRTVIAEDLCKNQERLEGDQTGKFIYRNFALFKFMNRRQEWKNLQGTSSKKKELLKEIFEGKQKKQKETKKPQQQFGDTEGKPDKDVEETKVTEESAVANNFTDETNSRSKKHKKSKKNNDLTSEVNDKNSEINDEKIPEDNMTTTSEEKKKRKRKKEKKRKIRGGDASTDMDVENVSPKKRKHEKSVSVQEENDDNDLSHSSKKKSKNEDSIADNEECNIKKKKKKKKNKSLMNEEQVDNVTQESIAEVVDETESSSSLKSKKKKDQSKKNLELSDTDVKEVNKKKKKKGIKS